MLPITLTALLLVPFAVAVPLERRQNGPDPATRAGQLQQGINANILAQMGEATATDTIQLLQTPGGDNNFQEFTVAKDNLMTFINAGIRIRENNQKIAPVDSPAVQGLAVVGTAQTMERDMAERLTGDPANDGPILTQLQAMFADGQRQNRRNSAAAGLIREATPPPS
ncbi:hypothetical protein K402DRAFT_394969 [Aulographum hederae CBS 113979]|uniref:Uncharacterized protein n=1 Tax=Aulographum hederae CBS 113979 TaxID=1176131 RepID=A0A6G1GWT4_9PEZI|nr:hypothetical protein K402DRAFT_394969 [Aulographum hederae CBS 113979]